MTRWAVVFWAVVIAMVAVGLVLWVRVRLDTAMPRAWMMPAPVYAQSDSIRVTEQLNVKRIPGPSTPVDAPSSETEVVAPLLPDIVFADVRVTGLEVDLRRAPPYIRDAIDFLVGWGKGDRERLARTALPTTTVQFPERPTPFALRDVRLILPASGIAVSQRTDGVVTELRVRTLRVREQTGPVRVRSGVLQVRPEGSGYRVLAVRLDR